MKYFAFIIFALAVIGCSSDTESSSDFEVGYDYLPLLDEGSIMLYEIEQTYFSNNGLDVETSRFFQREEVVFSSVDESGMGSMNVDIFTSETGGEPWVYNGAAKIEKNEIQGITTNKFDDRIISLSFPVQANKYWNGLSLIGGDYVRNVNGEDLNFYEGWNFQIESISSSFNGYNDVIEVIQANTENALSRRFSKEIYAKDIGLIYKEQEVLDTQCISDCEGLQWVDKAQKGMILRKTLITIE